MSSCIAAVEGALVIERRGARVAVHDFGARVLVGAAPTTFEIPLPYPDGALASAGGHALSVYAEGGATQVAATPLVAGREATPREISLGGEAAVVAVSRGYVLLSIGGRPALVHVGRGMLAHAAVLDVSAMSWAVALPDDRFLLRSPAGLELVAAATRRVERRLRIDVPATSPVVRAASGGARIWALTPDRRELAVYRLSDGKRQRISLGEAATSFVGHLESSWVIAEIGARLWAINLVSDARLALELPPGPGCALIPRGSGALLVRATGAAPEVWQLEHGGAFTGTGLPGGGSAPPPATGVRDEPRRPGAMASVPTKLDPAAGAAGAAPRPAEGTVVGAVAGAAAAPPGVVAGPSAASPELDGSADVATSAPSSGAGSSWRHPLIAGGPPGRVVPARALVLQLEPTSGSGEPSTAGLFVAPAVDVALSALASALRERWLDRVVQGWLEGAAASAEDTLAILVAELRYRMRGCGAPGLELSSAGNVIVRADGAAAEVPRWGTLWLGRDRVGMHRLATGARREALALDRETIGQIGRVLGLLVAGAGPAQIAAYAREAPAAARLFGHLVALDLLEPATAVPTFGRQVAPGTVGWLGGMTLLANLGGAHVLVDPSLPPAAADDALPVPAVADLPTLAAILLTGDHPRSLDAATLLRLDKRVPIHVPAGGAGGARIAAVVRELGFADVRPVVAGQRLALGRGGEVVVAGAAGGGSGRVAYVLRHGGAAALAAGAAPRDAAALAALAAIVRAPGDVVSPVFVEIPARARAPIEQGWAWLLEHPARWLASSPTPAAVVAALATADATADATIVQYADDVGGPPWPEVRRPELYDLYRIGAGLDGWIDPGA